MKGKLIFGPVGIYGIRGLAETLEATLPRLGMRDMVFEIVARPAADADHDRVNADSEARNALWPKLNRRVDELCLSVRANNCLRGMDITLVGELVRLEAGRLLKIKNFGRFSLRNVVEALAEDGLYLQMDTLGWEPPPSFKADSRDAVGLSAVAQPNKQVPPAPVSRAGAQVPAVRTVSTCPPSAHKRDDRLPIIVLLSRLWSWL